MLRGNLLSHFFSPTSNIMMSAIWTVFTGIDGGRKKFQIQLGLDIMNFAISKVWDGKSMRPGWMRQGLFVPFNCKCCYFYFNGHTTDITNKQGKQKVKVVSARTGLVSWTDSCTEVAVDIGRACDVCK